MQKACSTHRPCITKHPKTSICYHFRRVYQDVFKIEIGLCSQLLLQTKTNIMKKEVPLSLKLIRGAIGKEFVIKHYKDGAVKTKYPDMSGIVASTKQRKCRNLFKEAVAYAKGVIADSERKTCWQKKLRKRNAVYNAAVKEFMLREKKAKQQAFIATNRLLRNAMMNSQKNINSGIDRLNDDINFIPAMLYYQFWTLKKMVPTPWLVPHQPKSLNYHKLSNTV